MSFNLLRECRKSLVNSEPPILATVENGEPLDAVNYFGVIPKKSVRAMAYLEWRGIPNISPPMLARGVGMGSTTVTAIFRAGRYAKIDEMIDEYKDTFRDWETHEMTHRSQVFKPV